MPSDLKSFLLYLIAEPVGLGVLTAAALGGLFRWWEGSAAEPWHGPIRSHDKALVSSVAPPLLMRTPQGAGADTTSLCRVS